MNSGAGDTTQLVPGSPIRTPWDHSSVDNSPRPIAASHVLHRLLVPRHPPSALSNLTTKMLASTVQFSTNNHPHPPTAANPHHEGRPTNRAKMTIRNNPTPKGARACSFRTQQGVRPDVSARDATTSRTGPLSTPPKGGRTRRRPLPGVTCQCLRR
jgi:hypothetical protein